MNKPKLLKTLTIIIPLLLLVFLIILFILALKQQEKNFELRLCRESNRTLAFYDGYNFISSNASYTPLKNEFVIFNPYCFACFEWAENNRETYQEKIIDKRFINCSKYIREVKGG